MDVLAWAGAAAVSGVVAWIVGKTTARISIKTKTQESTEKLESRINDIEEAVPIILECLFVILLALKKGQINGDGDEVLKKLNAYLIKK